MGSAFNQVGAVRESDARGLAPTADLPVAYGVTSV